MRQVLRITLLVCAGLFLTSTVASAHHSQSAEFDKDQPVAFTGVVKEVEWTNPHGYVQVETQEADGKVLVYRVEIQAPNGLYRAGWRRDSVQPGTTVKFQGSRSRIAASMNVSGELTLPDGIVAFQGPGPGTKE